jgi:hypothetical protein
VALGRGASQSKMTKAAMGPFVERQTALLISSR